MDFIFYLTVLDLVSMVHCGCSLSLFQLCYLTLGPNHPKTPFFDPKPLPIKKSKGHSLQARFSFPRENGVRKTGSCRKTRACFSFARNRNELRKNRVSLDPCRFPLTREKRERKKTGRSFQRCLHRQRCVFVT